MTYCSNCGIIIETVKCPVCGYLTREPEKPGEERDSQPAQGHALGKVESHKHPQLTYGGVGFLMFSISAMILGVLPVVNWANNGSPLMMDSIYVYVIMLVATITIAIATYPVVSGFYGIFKHYKSYFSIVAMVFAIIGPVILLTFSLLAIDINTHDSWYYGSYTSYELSFVLWFGHMFMGLGAIIMGIALILARCRLGFKGTAIGTGTMMIISGGMLIGFLGFIGIGWFMFSISCILAAILLFIAKPFDPKTLHGPIHY